MDDYETNEMIKREVFRRIELIGQVAYGGAFLFIALAFLLPGCWFIFIPGSVILGVIGHLCFHRIGELK